MIWASAQRKLVAKCIIFVSTFWHKEISWFHLNVAGQELKMFTKETDLFMNLSMSQNDKLASRSTKSKMTQNDLSSENDTKESLNDTEDIAPSKKAKKKRSNKHPKNLNEVKTQHSFSEAADDMFCEMVTAYLKI